MATNDTKGVALVAGGSGIVGHSVAMELKGPGWQVRALARRPVSGIETITLDLTNGDAIAAALRPGNDTTHLFYAALSPDPNLSIEAERNGQMLGNLLDGLNTVGAPLRRVVSYEGFKIYGIHLGANVRTPARESDPPHMPPNIYLSQRAQLRARPSRASWDNVALIKDISPHDVWNERNIVPTGPRSARPEWRPRREENVGAHVRGMRVSGRRPHFGAEMNAVDLEPLVTDDPRKRCPYCVEAVQQVSKHLAIPLGFNGQVRVRTQSRVKQMCGFIGRPERGRDRVPIGEIDCDGLDPSNRPARKRTHPPALPFQFHGHRVADDAAATGDEGYAPRIAGRHIGPPDCNPNSVGTLKARLIRHRRRDRRRQRSCSRRKPGKALRQQSPRGDQGG